MKEQKIFRKKLPRRPMPIVQKFLFENELKWLEGLKGLMTLVQKIFFFFFFCILYVHMNNMMNQKRQTQDGFYWVKDQLESKS